MRKSSDIRLGQLLVQRKLCTLRNVNEALLRQKDLRQRNENVPLGRILVDSGVLNSEVLRAVLAELGVLRLSCKACGAEYSSESFDKEDGGSVRLCPKCKDVLTPVGTEDGGPPPPADAGGAKDAGAKDAEAAGEAPNPSAEGDTAEQDVFLGKVLGGCQLTERIARGGMGVVYKARQLNLGRTVAVKVLSSDLASDATFVRRFVQEARSAAQLNHGNIVHVNDVGEFQGVFYFVMEYVDGQNLKQVLRKHKTLDTRRALEIIMQVCQALRHAHRRGIIHRDIKPENIMLTQEGVVKLADLGLAKRTATENSVNLTHAGSILGTPYYMAPEQAKDFSKVDRRSDIYSLGVTFYRMITGKVPFEGRSPIEVMIKAIDGRKVPVHEFREDVPQEVEKIIDRMMHKSPESRYQDVDEVLRDIVPAMQAVPAT